MLRAGLKFARGVLFVLAVFPSLLVIAWFGAAQSNSNVASRRREFLQNLVAAALERTHHVVRYDPGYLRIPYPRGDVPADTGVCTDEIIRSYRSVGVDLQREVHEDMVQNFDPYPQRRRWLLSRPDSNIDHRRVPNLMVFFLRKGEVLPLSTRPKDYAPGDLVTWDRGGGVPHIGVVVRQKSSQGGRYMIVHNIGQGPGLEDALARGFNLRCRCPRIPEFRVA